MKIDSIKIEGYKCFEELDFKFENLSIFVGENNAGKSAIFSAINKFFQSTNKSSPICPDDFYIDDTGKKRSELSISISFSNLSDQAIEAFSEYTSTPRVTFKLKSKLLEGTVVTIISGVRFGMVEFSNAFSLSEVTPIKGFNEEYETLREKFSELPPSKTVKNKQLKLDALREYESERPEDCVFIESQVQAYGTVGPNHIIERFIKWVFIPAVKDASEEATEGKNVLSELVSFAARRKTNFDERIEEIQLSVSNELEKLQLDQQSTLDTITAELNSNFRKISMGKEKVELNWEHATKDLRVQPPKAAAKIISGQHKGPIGLFGHGLQRNYLVDLSP